MHTVFMHRRSKKHLDIELSTRRSHISVHVHRPLTNTCTHVEYDEVAEPSGPDHQPHGQQLLIPPRFVDRQDE
jgi:hypothetical protein